MRIRTSSISVFFVPVISLVIISCRQATPAPLSTLPPATASRTTTPAAGEAAPSLRDESPERTFQIIPAESEASYTVEEEFFAGAVQNLGKQLGLFTSVGATQAISGQITLSLGDQPGLVGGEFVVDISTLKSDDRRRDERIQDQFLRSRLFPLAVFKPQAIEGLAGPYVEGQTVDFQLIGEMTIREVTQPVTFDISAMIDDRALRGSAETMILMTDYDFDPPVIAGFMQAENEVLIKVTFVASELE